MKTIIAVAVTGAGVMVAHWAGTKVYEAVVANTGSAENPIVKLGVQALAMGAGAVAVSKILH